LEPDRCGDREVSVVCTKPVCQNAMVVERNQEAVGCPSGTMSTADETIASELTQLLGHDATSWTSTALLHNPANAVTGEITRVRSGDWSAVVKVLSANNAGHVAHWHASHAPSHWNYWRREQLVYQNGLPSLLAGGGLEAPRLLGSFQRSDVEIALWLEDLGDGAPGGWTIPRLARAAWSLGYGQGAVAAHSTTSYPWLSRRFLREYSTSKPVDWSLISDRAAWQQPLIRQCWPASLKDETERLFAERERWLDLRESLPRTLSHLDFWPNNLIALDPQRTAALDWTFTGDGALGEDVGNLVPDSVFDHFLPASDLPELDDAVFTSYVDGLRAGGWRGDERIVRLAMCASAVKYLFLIPLLLERASDETHLAYGGAEALPAELRYGDRGATLMYLTGWAREARELASQTRISPGLRVM
jgi:hypothetical protein